MFWFFLNRVDWISWIVVEMWLAISRAFARLAPSSELALLTIFSFFLLRLFTSALDLLIPFFS